MKPVLRTTVAKRVMQHVSDRTGVSVESMVGSGRSQQVLAARRRTCRLFQRLGYSLPNIGWAMHRHHTTVLHYLRMEAR